MEHTQFSGIDGDTPKVLEIRRILAKNGTFISDTGLASLALYAELLRKWNTKLNLVSRRDIENLWEAHILHSLAIVMESTIVHGSTVLDLGSGGGLPGIPVKIVRPDIDITLIDATRKKMDAVGQMVEDLGLRGVDVVWGRVEDKTVRSTLAEKFDVVIARAVGPLADLVLWSRPLLKFHGRRTGEPPQLITLKGGDLRGEIDKVRRSKHVKEVTAKDLTFDGSEIIPGTHKQIVIITFDTQESFIQ